MNNILKINGEYCFSLEELKGFFSRLDEEFVYEDLLDFGIHGDISEWLRGIGEQDLAEEIDKIDKSLGDSDFINAMSRILSGNDLPKILVKKPYDECFSIESVSIIRDDKKAIVSISVMVRNGVKENYEIEIGSNWGKKSKLFNPSECEEDMGIEERYDFHRRSGKGDFGDVHLYVDGEEISFEYKSEKDEKEGKTGSIYEVNGVNFKMIKVEGGTFQMGATSEQGSDAYGDESSVHSVTLPDYYIGETEVTQELWKAVMGNNPSTLWKVVMGNNPSTFKGDQKPVECVSWDDCQSFIKRLNELTGKSFRLPTEAEWEYAARGGNKSKGYKYSGGNDINEVAWYKGNSNSHTHDVKTKSPNELGIYDMSGNVYEWCKDWYGDYSSSSQTNPKGPSYGWNYDRNFVDCMCGLYRVLRGGSWSSSARSCRVSNRILDFPGSRDSNYGFRLAL